LTEEHATERGQLLAAIRRSRANTELPPVAGADGCQGYTPAGGGGRGLPPLRLDTTSSATSSSQLSTQISSSHIHCGHQSGKLAFSPHHQPESEPVYF